MRLEHLTGVAHHAAGGAVLAAQQRSTSSTSSGERGQRGKRPVELRRRARPRPVPVRPSTSGTPAASSGRRRGRSRRAPRWATPGPGQRAAVGQRPSWSDRRATAPRRSRPAASSGAGSPWCRWASARTRRPAPARPGQPGRSSWVFLRDLAHVHARDADVGLLGQLGGLGELDREPVALGAQRHRAAEGQPQVQQDGHAGEGEDHHRGQLGDAGALLDHRPPPLAFRGGRGRAGTDLCAVGDVQQLGRPCARRRVGRSRELLEDPEGPSREKGQHQPAPRGPVGILDAEQRGAVVRCPTTPRTGSPPRGRAGCRPAR